MDGEDDALNCLRCGTCCFSDLEAYVPVSGDDHARLGEHAEALTHFVGNRCYMAMRGGHCAALEVSPGRFACTVYEARPEVCRALGRGSPACRAETWEKGDRPRVAVRRLVLGRPGSLTARFVAAARERGIEPARGLAGLFRVVMTLAFAPAPDEGPEGVLAAWRGCSAGRHALALGLAREHGCPGRAVHRVYFLGREALARRFGEATARRALLPGQEGIWDVHTSALVAMEGRARETRIDLSHPVRWDGESDMDLACGEGEDTPVDEPARAAELLERLVRAHCDPAARARYHAALLHPGE